MVSRLAVCSVLLLLAGCVQTYMARALENFIAGDQALAVVYKRAPTKESGECVVIIRFGAPGTNQVYFKATLDYTSCEATKLTYKKAYEK